MNQAVVAESVDASRADECAELDGAFCFAHVMVDRDMTFGVNLVSVDAEFSFDVNWHRTSIRHQNYLPRFFPTFHQFVRGDCVFDRKNIADRRHKFVIGCHL